MQWKKGSQSFKKKLHESHINCDFSALCSNFWGSGKTSEEFQHQSYEMTNSTVEAIIKRKSADLQGFFPWPLRGFFDDHFSVVGSEGSAEVPSSRKRLTIALNHNERNKRKTKRKILNPESFFHNRLLNCFISWYWNKVEFPNMSQEKEIGIPMQWFLPPFFQRFFSIFLVEKTHNWKSSWCITTNIS